MVHLANWDIYESALLLDAYFMTKDGKIEKNTIVDDLSKELRLRARHLGFVIDDVYRNIAGIQWQMQYIGNAYNGVKTGERECPKVFSNIVRIYNTNSKKYRDVLLVAKMLLTCDKLKKLEFAIWLTEQSLSGCSIKMLLVAIESAMQFAKNHGIYKESLWDINEYKDFNKIRNSLSANRLFKHNFPHEFKIFEKYGKKYTEFLKDKYTEPSYSLDKNVKKECFNYVNACSALSTKDCIIFILRDDFSNGFKLNSSIAVRKFHNIYEEKYGDSLCKISDEIKQSVANSIFIYDNRAYVSEDVMEHHLKEELFAFIDESLNGTNSTLYYDQLFNKFNEQLYDSLINDTGMLKSFLRVSLGEDFVFENNYMYKKGETVVSVDTQIASYMLEQMRPVSYIELINRFQNIPQDVIKKTLENNRSVFIFNGQKEYVHINVFSFTDTDLLNIGNLVQEMIDIYGYISFSELFEAIQKKYPRIYECNQNISEAGLQRYIKRKLEHRFSFKRNIISAKTESWDTNTLYAEFCLRHKEFTLEELKKFKSDLCISMNLELVYNYSMRIDDNHFVSNSFADFKVEETDLELSKYVLDTDYIPISDLNNFKDLPYAKYSWNEFLIEQYLAKFSGSFSLEHFSYNELSVTGVMVKKGTRYNSYDDILIDALSKIEGKITKQSALDYLSNNKLIAVKRLSNIDQIVLKAIEKKNRHGGR